MAGRAKKLRRKTAKADSLPERYTVEIRAASVIEAAAKLYGQGFRRSQVARALAEYLVPNSKARNREQLEASARTKLKRWEMNKDFRDKVYKYAVVKLDMSTPEILGGVAGAAKKGRVDAARLVLELTGRHTSDKTTNVPITVQIGNIPRPQHNGYDKSAAPKVDVEDPDAPELRSTKRLRELEA